MKRLISVFMSVVIMLTFLSVPSYAQFDDKYELCNKWDENLKEYSHQLSEDYNIPYAMIIAIAYHESRFKADVGTKYIGLMQVGSTKDVLNFLKSKELRISKNDLYDPKTNLKAGCLIFEYAMSVTDNLKDAVYVYACGESAVKKRKRDGLSCNKATNEIYELYEEFNEYLSRSLDSNIS